MAQPSFNIPGKLVLEKVTPRNPLSGVDNSELDLPFAVPSKKMVTLDKLESSQHIKEGVEHPYTKSIHSRYHNESSLEMKHKKLFESNPNAFKKKIGECGHFLLQVSKTDRLQSWKPADQRKPHKDSNNYHLSNSQSLSHLPDNEFTRTLVSSASSRASRSRGTRGGTGFRGSSNSGVSIADSRFSNGSGPGGGISGGGGGMDSSSSVMSGLSYGSRSRPFTADSDDGSLSSTESDYRNSPPGTVGSGSRFHGSTHRTSNSSRRKPRVNPHPSTHSAYLIKSVELDPYELHDEMSMTSRLSTSSSLQDRHDASRLRKIKAFEKTFEKLRESARKEREHTKQLIKNGEKGPVKPEDVRAALTEKVVDDIFKFEVRHPTKDMLLGYSKQNLEELSERSKTVQEEVHNELHKPVYTSAQRSQKRSIDLTNRRAQAMIATGGSSSFIKRSQREQMKLSSPDLKQSSISPGLFSRKSSMNMMSRTMSHAGSGMDTALGPLNENGEFADGTPYASRMASTMEFKIGKSFIVQDTISCLYDAIKFPTIILTNVKLKTIVKQRVMAAAQPSLCERTRPETAQDETYHRDQHYDIHIYGSTRGVAVILLCWPELHHLSTEVFHSTEPEELIHWFAPTTAATICNSRQIGKIILTKNQIREYSVPAPPKKVIHSRLEDEALAPPKDSDEDSSDEETISHGRDNRKDEKDVQVLSTFGPSENKTGWENKDLPAFETWGSASSMRSASVDASGDGHDDFGAPIAIAADSPHGRGSPATKAFFGGRTNNVDDVAVNVVHSRRASAAFVDVNGHGGLFDKEADAEEAKLNYNIKLEWLRWFMLMKHRVIVEARPALTSLRRSIMGNAIHNIAHGYEESMSPTMNRKIIANAGMHTDEYNVILCRPKVPTHIHGYKWSLLEEETEDTSCGLGAKKKVKKEKELSKKQVALYFRDTAGSCLGETAENMVANFSK